MKNRTFRFSILFALTAALALAQTATPNTTLCAAATATARSVCLTAVTHVVNQTGLYVDGEYMTVTLSSSQTISANSYVPVQRASRAGTPPAAHASGAVVWLALTPGESNVPGTNGFLFGTQLGDIGTCTRTSEAYLPHIWPNRGVKRDCTTAGFWVDYTPMGPQTGGVQVLSASTATVPGTSGNYILTYASGTTAVTLVAPTAGIADGAVVTFTTYSAEAHTITCSSCIGTGGSQASVLTFAAHMGASVTLMAYNGYWLIISNNLVTLTS
jgi:hypothetical protein